MLTHGTITNRLTLRNLWVLLVLNGIFTNMQNCLLNIFHHRGNVMTTQVSIMLVSNFSHQSVALLFTLGSALIILDSNDRFTGPLASIGVEYGNDLKIYAEHLASVLRMVEHLLDSRSFSNDVR